jgi:AAA domain
MTTDYLSETKGQQLSHVDRQLFGAAQIVNVREWVGRDELLAELAADLGKGRKVLVLHGQSGIGKTSLAVKLMESAGVNSSCSTLDPNCVYDNVLYCQVDDSDSFSLIGECLNAFGLAADRAKNTPAQIIELILTKLEGQRWLIVIDRFEDLMELNGDRSKSPEVGNLLQALAYGAHNSQIIITTRNIPTVDLTDKQSNAIDTAIVRVEAIGGISPADSLQLLEDLGAQDCQIDLDWIVNRVAGNIFVLRQLAAYSKKCPEVLRHQPDLVLDDAMPIIKAQWEKQSAAAGDLLQRMCVLRIAMSAGELTILRLLAANDDAIVTVTESDVLETIELLSGLVSCGLLLELSDSATGENLYVLDRSIRETLRSIFHTELPELWSYGARFYGCFEHPSKFRTLADWRLFLEELHFWWLLGKCEIISIMLVGSLIPSLGQWGYWSLQHEWCDRVLPYTKGSNYRYCSQTLVWIYQYLGEWEEAEIVYHQIS